MKNLKWAAAGMAMLAAGIISLKLHAQTVASQDAFGLTGTVLMPSFTFVATAHSLQWQQITPVFCDVAPGTHNIDPAQIERLITPNTSSRAQIAP